MPAAGRGWRAGCSRRGRCPGRARRRGERWSRPWRWGAVCVPGGAAGPCAAGAPGPGSVEAHADGAGPGRRTRWGGEQGPAALPGYPWQRRTVPGQRSSPAVCWLWCSCAAGAVKDLHVHQHMHFRGRCGNPGTPARNPGSRNPRHAPSRPVEHSRGHDPVRGRSGHSPQGWRCINIQKRRPSNRPYRGC